MEEKKALVHVVEAAEEDIGYGRAGLHVDVQKQLDLTEGDIVKIIGDRVTAAVVCNLTGKDEKKKYFRIDEITRENAGLSLGDTVSIKKAQVRSAESITLGPVITKNQQIEFGKGIERLLKKGLFHRPILSNDLFVLQGTAIMGNLIRFAVTETNPTGITVVDENTTINVLDQIYEHEVTK